MKIIDNGHYRISDKLAGELAKQYNRKGMPSADMEWRVKYRNSLWWLSRTPYRYRTDSPKRGWVWCLHGEAPLVNNPG